ncbi:cell death regulator Aven [Cynoglossus semilaevis]|uniref:Apoptosis, caspase activation inhibitor n=1 Tax=Cynoglossus semilaevis TaxID=244447 RepID=A0A3P8UY80_CYNSE|nr:cell death regulator Aven [Cynoglossus semilaevis]
MEGRMSRGRGGSWKRGGRGGHDGDSAGSEHRGRGRGGHHRGRGKRDHYRGRGRGGGGDQAVNLHQNQDGGDRVEEDDYRGEVFSRRKLESNWDRYKESEKQEPGNDDTPTKRGEDFQVLLETAGDSFTQFRFLEEKGWEMDSFTGSEMSPVFVDLPALAQTLQQVPLHQRLHLEAELLQVLTPVDLPVTIPAPKQEVSKPSTLTPVSVASPKALNLTNKTSPNPVIRSDSKVSSGADVEPPVDDGDEDLELLLKLEKPVMGVEENISAVVTEEEEEEEKKGERGRGI